jgi:DNA adenine methylase
MPKEPVLRPPFCRIGSKRDIADMVMSYFPDDFDVYVEPFIGSGAIYWKKDPADHKEVINDLDSKLIADYRLLKATDARNFQQGLDSVPELQRFIDKTPKSDADKLTYGVVSRCNRWMGKEEGLIYNDSNPYNKLKNLDLYQQRMRNTIIRNKSYEQVINEFDSPKTFFYLDPPYEESKKTGKLYTHGGMGFDYEKLEQVLSKTKGKWLLSINDSPNIRSIFAGYFYHPFTVKAKSRVKAQGKTTIGGKDRKELLISNYSNA